MCETEIVQPIKPADPLPCFHNVGIVELASTGRSFRIMIHDCPCGMARECVVYLPRDALRQVDTGHRKDATVYQKRIETENRFNLK